MLGLPDSILDSCAENVLELNQSSLVTYEEFQMLYFEVFRKLQLEGRGKNDQERCLMMQDLDEIENQERILQNYKTRNGHDPMNTDMNFGEDQGGLPDDPEVMLTGSR